MEARILAATLRHSPEPIQPAPFNRLQCRGGKTVYVGHQVLHLFGPNYGVSIWVDELQDGEGLVTRWEDSVEVPGGVERPAGWIGKPADLLAVLPFDDHNDAQVPQSGVSPGARPRPSGSPAGATGIGTWRAGQSCCSRDSTSGCSSISPGKDNATSRARAVAAVPAG